MQYYVDSCRVSLEHARPLLRSVPSQPTEGRCSLSADQTLSGLGYVIAERLSLDYA